MLKKITLHEYLTSSCSYPDREDSPELTPELLKNAEQLLQDINGLLFELGVKKVKISSGFRPSSVNASIPSSAKKSAHMTCRACDIVDDKDQTLGKLIASKPELLRKHSLMIEDLGSTIGKTSNWIHLDCVDRPDRPSRSFKP